MGIRQFKPVTKSSRFRSVSDFSEITRSRPEKSLTEPLTKSGTIVLARDQVFTTRFSLLAFRAATLPARLS